MTICPRCDADLSFLGDYPQCLMCGFEDYSLPTLPGYQYREKAVVRIFAEVEGPRACEECGADISDRFVSAVYCLDCLHRRTLERN